MATVKNLPSWHFSMKSVARVQSDIEVCIDASGSVGLSGLMCDKQRCRLS